MRKTSVYLLILLFIIVCSGLIIIMVQKSHCSSVTKPCLTNNGQDKIEANGPYKLNDANDPTLPAIKSTDCIVHHSYYTLCYYETYEQATWVAYKLTSGMLSNTAKRKDNFRADPMIKTASVTPADYAKSGYDKGHLCPAADMIFSAEAMSETFFMSNMSPQNPQFNRGIWKILEEKVRDWAKANDELYITTGPVFTKVSIRIGKNKVAVPQYYYKVILDHKQPGIKGIGFIMKNEGSTKNLWDFAVTIDSVEKFAGIYFYTALPDAEEDALEKQCNYSSWR